MSRFVGRIEELSRLKDLLYKKSASLVTIQGRRRIGKSTLIRRFCHLEQIPCYEIQGLPPRPKMSNQNQLDEFAKHLARHLNVKKIKLENWTQAFEQLDTLCSKALVGKKKFVILLDEISWMGARDPDFSGFLKDVWDRLLSQNPNLILVLCGSVSSWIQKNILENTGFVGRISKEIRLQELSIMESQLLLKNSLQKISPQEIAQILSVTGGVPKYLEEFAPYKTVTVGIRELCFHPSGFLFNELDSIFSEIFGKKNILYLQILRTLIDTPQSPSDLAAELNHPLNGDWSEKLNDLELAGFIRRDYTWNFNEATLKLSKLKVCDNYTRFYLKYIQPKKQRLIKYPLRSNDNLEFLPWNTIFGLQFETLILNNVTTLIRLAQIPNSDIVQIGPYFQTMTKLKPGVQIDCLVQCKKGLLHIFEIKSGKTIGVEVVREVQEKSAKLKLPKGFSMRHYLVYLGELTEEMEDSDFFDRKISFADFLK